MALTRDEKKAQIVILTEKFKKSPAVVFAHYIGLTVLEVSKLRNNLRGREADMQVAKKTLIQIAAKDAGLPEVSDTDIPGPIACIFSGGDSLAGAQEIWNFGKDHKPVKIVGAIFEGKILSQAEAISLAKIPGRQALLGIFAGMIRSPLTSFAGMIASPLSGFARAVSEMAKKKPSQP